MVFAATFVSCGSQDAAAANAPVRPNPAPVKPELAPPNVDALVEEILQQPLFSPSRQSVDAAEREQRSETETAPPKMPGRLAGMTIGPEAREALFEREGEKPVAAKEGQVIDGWTVASIQADQVVLRSTSGEQVLKPTNAAGIKPLPTRATNNNPVASPKKPLASGAATKPARPQAPALQQARKPVQPAAGAGR
jgi:hypothetical protein